MLIQPVQPSQPAIQETPGILLPGGLIAQPYPQRLQEHPGEARLLHLPSASAGIEERGFAHPLDQPRQLKIIGTQWWGCNGYSLAPSISPTTRRCAAWASNQRINTAWARSRADSASNPASGGRSIDVNARANQASVTASISRKVSKTVISGTPNRSATFRSRRLSQPTSSANSTAVSTIRSQRLSGGPPPLFLPWNPHATSVLSEEYRKALAIAHAD